MKTLLAILGLILTLLLILPEFADAETKTCLRGGTREQKISVRGENRFFLSYVPLKYDCVSRIALVIDLHGTVADARYPEEAIQLKGAVEFADRRGVLLLRPRSLSTTQNMKKVYSWDAGGPQGIARNTEFIATLVKEAKARFAINESQIYLMGYGNGSQMAVQFLAVKPQIFSGFGFVGGGLWQNPGPLAIDPLRTRIYVADGLKDENTTKKWQLIDYLARFRFPAALVFDRKTDSSHQLTAWHYLDFWNWMQGRVLPTARLPINWKMVTLPGAAGILDLTKDARGFIYASTANGQVWKQTGKGIWKRLYTVPGRTPLSGLCVLESRVVVAGGANVLAQSNHRQREWRAVVLPDQGKTWVNDVVCGKTHFIAATFPYGLIGSDIERMVPTRVLGPVPGSELTTTALSPEGNAFSLGARGAIGFSIDSGRTFRFTVNPALERRSFFELKWQSGFWGVGENGVVGNISENGIVRTLETGARDLYAVDVTEKGLAAAAGFLGALVVSRDGARSWRNISIASNSSFSAVVIDNENTVILGDETGRIYYMRPIAWP